MMTVKAAGPKIDESDIARLTSQIGKLLPADYREFLMRFNGGLPDPDIIAVPDLPGSPTDVQVFFGIQRSIESSNIAWNWHVYNNRIPDAFLPIACGSGGNLYCINLETTGNGEVFYIDFGRGSAQTYRIAATFTEFADSLRGCES